MNKTILSLIAFLFLASKLSAGQFTGSFNVGGSYNNFYPVVFEDVGRNANVATELTIGRYNIHTDQNGRGSIIASFKFHVNDWGNGSEFIDADIKQYIPITLGSFVAGWKDASVAGTSHSIVIWLRGGSTTYFWSSDFQLTPAVWIPSYTEPTSGVVDNFKTALDPYVNTMGTSSAYTAYFNGTGTNYFGGNIAIGTYDPKGYRLAVNGAAIFTKVVVKPYPWPDYVFNAGYRLRPLSEVEQYIQQHHHLPEVPAAEEVEKNGVEIGNNQAVLLKKIEELTLYVIEQQKNQQKADQRLGALEKENKQLKKLLHKK